MMSGVNSRQAPSTAPKAREKAARELDFRRHLRSRKPTTLNKNRRSMMSTRARYQFGCLTRRKRIRTEDVWQFRFYETTAEGRRCRRSRMIGTVVEYPTRADALRMVERFRLRLNLEHRFAQPPKTKVNLRSLFHLVYQHGRRWELTDANPIDLVRQRGDRKSTRLNSSHQIISYAVFCLKKKRHA